MMKLNLHILLIKKELVHARNGRDSEAKRYPMQRELTDSS